MPDMPDDLFPAPPDDALAWWAGEPSSCPIPPEVTAGMIVLSIERARRKMVESCMAELVLVRMGMDWMQVPMINTIGAMRLWAPLIAASHGSILLLKRAAKAGLPKALTAEESLAKADGCLAVITISCAVLAEIAIRDAGLLEAAPAPPAHDPEKPL